MNNATEVLKKHSPENAEYFEENKQTYFAKIDELKTEAIEKLSKIPEEPTCTCNCT